MSTFASIDEARAYFEGDRFAMESGITLDALGESSATLRASDRQNFCAVTSM